MPDVNRFLADVNEVVHDKSTKFKLKTGWDYKQSSNYSKKNNASPTYSSQPGSLRQIIVRAECSRFPVNLLIDTGATVSLVSTRFIQHLNMWNKVVPTRTKITGLGGKLIPVPGEIRLPITLGKCYTEQVFIVCDNLDNEFLIGMDLLNKIQAKIDLASKTIITPQGETTFLTKPISIKNRLKIRSAKNITIPAHSEGYLQAKIPIRNARENYEGIVEGYRKLSEEKGIFITG